MTLYPTRAKLSHDAYRELIVDGEAWKLMQSIVGGQRIILFLPGSIKFGLVGFFGVVPIASIIVLLMFTFFSNSDPAFVGKFMVGAGIFLTFIHGFMMMLVGLGLTYAQQDLVRYFVGLTILAFTCLLSGILFAAPLGILIFSAVGCIASCALLLAARSKSFTLYADLMRIKKIYYQNGETRKAS